MMDRLEFDEPLPWTSKPLYEWFVTTVQGVKVQGAAGQPGESGLFGVCCVELLPDDSGSPQFMAPVVLADPAFAWWLDNDPPMIAVAMMMRVLVHEARHAEGYGHDCPALREGRPTEWQANSVDLALLRWIADHTDPTFVGSGNQKKIRNIEDDPTRYTGDAC